MNDLRRTTVLVTGGFGFLGHRVVRLGAARGLNLTVVELAHAGARGADPMPGNPEVIYVDLTNPSATREALAPWRWDATIHLAAPVTAGWARLPEHYGLLQTGVLVTANLMAAIPPDWEGSVVMASSMTVYGRPDQLPVREDAALRPLHLYGAAKAVAESLVRVMCPHRARAMCVRMPGLFAEDRTGGAVYHFTRAALRNQPLRLSPPDGAPWDLLHVDDAAEGLLQSLGATIEGPCNLSHGELVSLPRVARMIVDAAGSGSAVELEDEDSYPSFQMDTALAREGLDWQPPTLESRLQGYVAKIREGEASA